MGDSPGFISLARRLPQLQGRVVDTADGGETWVRVRVRARARAGVGVRVRAAPW